MFYLLHLDVDGRNFALKHLDRLLQCASVGAVPCFPSLGTSDRPSFEENI
jgi:hypothetical protein